MEVVDGMGEQCNDEVSTTRYLISIEVMIPLLQFFEHI